MELTVKIELGLSPVFEGLLRGLLGGTKNSRDNGRDNEREREGAAEPAQDGLRDTEGGPAPDGDNGYGAAFAAAVGVSAGGDNGSGVEAAAEAPALNGVGAPSSGTGTALNGVGAPSSGTGTARNGDGGQSSEGMTDEELRTVMDIAISRLAGNDWRENKDPRATAIRKGCTRIFKAIAAHLGGEGCKPTQLPADKRLTFAKHTEGIYLNNEGQPEWLPF